MNKKFSQVVVSMFLAMMVAWGAVGQLPRVHADALDLQIEVDHDHLTLNLHDARLVDVVERVAQTLFLTSHVAPGLEETLVTLTVNDVPFRQGLAKLLANTNYVLTNRDLFVWARGGSSKEGEWRERDQKVLPSEPVVIPKLSEEELQHKAIFGEDPETRITAMEMLGDRGVEKAMPTIIEALNDYSPEARGMALELLSETEGLIPLDQIAKIVSDDLNLEQRLEAIVVLASRNEEAAHAVLQHALHDFDPEVLELAKSILQDMQPGLELDELQ